MWTLRHIHAKNLCAFRQLDYNVQQQRTTLIFGNNLDNDSQASNGSGKSALIEAIAIVLTGSPLRKVGVDEIINDNENEAVISAILKNDMLGEQLTIYRQLSRKQPQVIQVIKQTGPYDTDCEDVAQASVADYNKYILDTIGLTKEEIYANFILSKHKYTSFLSSSDKDKKEIINRFSNGILVDESLAILQADMAPIQEELKSAEGNVAMASGKVSAISEQIATELAEATEKSQNKSKRIAELKDKIANKREYIREQNSIISKNNERLDALDIVDAKLQKLEKSSKVIEELQIQINTLFGQHGLSSLPDYVKRVESLITQIDSLHATHKQLQKDAKAKEKELAAITKSLNSIKTQYEQFEATYNSQSSTLKAEMQRLARSVEELQEEQAKLQRKRQQIERTIASLQAQLAGVIMCPKCSHEFTLAGDVDIEGVRKQVSDKQDELEDTKQEFDDKCKQVDDITEQGRNKRKSYNTLAEQKATMSAEVNNAQVLVNNAQAELNRISSSLLSITGSIDKITKEITDIRLELFDKAFEILDIAIKGCETESQNAEINRQNADGAIKSYEEAIKEIEESSATDLIDNLKASKERYEEEWNKAIAHQEEVAAKLADYKAQEATFIEFKTHLANTKINDLSRITNEFLERIGSDIRIAFSGYTVLKSGKIRDKISISLIRDGVDCGSFDKFSEGEKARVNLANILAMHKLTNVNCAEGRGLDLLVLDEILDATDESGLANIFEALNSLQITSLVVSHGNIAENYPYKLVVNKQNGVSFING